MIANNQLGDHHDKSDFETFVIRDKNHISKASYRVKMNKGIRCCKIKIGDSDRVTESEKGKKCKNRVTSFSERLRTVGFYMSFRIRNEDLRLAAVETLFQIRRLQANLRILTHLWSPLTYQLGGKTPSRGIFRNGKGRIDRARDRETVVKKTPARGKKKR